MANLQALIGQMDTGVNEVGTNCDELLLPSKVKAQFELETTIKKPFGEDNRDAGSGSVAVISKTQACQDSLDKLTGTFKELLTAIDALGLPANDTAVFKKSVTDYEYQFKYAQNALVLATIAGAADSNPAFDVNANPGAVIGLCIYQPTTSETATCWGYTPDADRFDGYNMTPAVWNALPEAQQKLTAANLANNLIGTDSVVDYFRQWYCTGLDNLSPVVEAGRKAALCQKVIPGAEMAKADDPTFVLGDMTIYVYNSTTTTAQAANRKLGAAEGFKGNSFYSYNVNTGALSGMALSAAAISALVLSHF